ncbi:MAG: hypothetical protein V3V10_04320 [Planctomycetota bacterium]
MIALYRKGATHTIRGVTCEMGRFETKRLQSLLNSGWVTNPQDLLEAAEVVEVEEPVEVAEVVKPTAKQPKKTRKPRKKK